MDKDNTQKIWILYTAVSAFSLYWLSNLLLWFPWSINANLGILLMLTAGTLLWAIGVYKSLIKKSGMSLLLTSVLIAVIFIFVAVIQDYVFFGIIRKAITELYHPTTLYGYAFLVALPFIEYMVLRKRNMERAVLQVRDIIGVASIGIVSLILLSIIIVFDIKVTV